VADIPGAKTTKQILQRDKAKSSKVGFDGDEDWFKVQLKRNNEYSFQVKGAATGGGFTLGDAEVAIYDSSGNELAYDDDGGLNRNARLEFTPSQTGTFFVSARGHGDSTGTYKVSYQLVDQAPRDVSGPPDDDDGFDTEATIKLGQTRLGSIQPTSDDDWFKIKLQPGSYVVEARNVNTDGPFRAYPHILDSAGALIDGDREDVTDSDERGSDIDFEIASAGTYFIAVRDSLDLSTGNYSITVAPNLV
jgi:hypothetical protein